MWIPTRGWMNAMLSQIFQGSTPVGYIVANGFVGLVKAPFAPSVDSVLSDFPEADYSGYARQPAAGGWVGPFIGEGNFSLVQLPSMLFQPNDTITFNVIYGAMLIGNDSVTLLGGEVFDAPIPLNSVLNQLTIIPRFGLSPLSNYGMSVVAP